MWYGIMKEFNCKATSTWSEWGRAEDAAFTHRQLGEMRQEWKAQLDYIIGPRWKTDEAYIYNDVTQIWDSWDHHTIHARIQEDEIVRNFSCEEKENEVDSMEAERQMCKKIEFKKESYGK